MTIRSVDPLVQPSADDPSPPGPDPVRLSTRRPLAAALSSLGLGALGIWFATDPGHNPLADPERTLIRALWGTTACTAVLLALAAVGVVAGAWSLRSRRTAPRLPLVAGVVQLLGLGIALQSVSTIALAGYLVALVLPLALVWLIVQVVRRYPRLRWLVLAALAVALVGGFGSGALAGRHLAELGTDLAGGFARQAVPLVFTVAVAVSVGLWASVVAHQLQVSGRAELVGAWVQRHRRGLTVLAALGPVPYGLLRASWLTPWPLLSPGGEILTPEIRLWGLLLGGGAIAGCVLTLGLIRPWGGISPRWMPGLAGRRVPPAAAIVPGALVAGLVTVSAAPMLRGILAPAAGTVFSGFPVLERLLAVLLFPFWIWGPALALAVWGYARSRR